jgi:hypothetical protein
MYPKCVYLVNKRSTSFNLHEEKYGDVIIEKAMEKNKIK